MYTRHIPNGTSAGLVMEIPAGRETAGLLQAVEALYEEHHHAIYRYLVLTRSSADDADEFVQEAYLRLLQMLLRGESIRNPRHWLFRVAHNLRADRLRECERQPGIAAEEQGTGGADPRPNPEIALLLNERAERLRAALAQLTQRQSEILHLRAEGLKLREIAELFGITLQSVSEMCARAMYRVGRFVNE